MKQRYDLEVRLLEYAAHIIRLVDQLIRIFRSSIKTAEKRKEG
jgi:hypothetical protein